MIKKLCVTGAVAAAAGLLLLSVPAQADTRASNSSSNRSAVQAGNIFGGLVLSNVAGRSATSVNNVNGIAGTAVDDSELSHR
ncbi:hypothetical protein AB0L05_41525 [Nonomuraea pusilla]|uniref:hypothetical protein n=1 Tax=Nonomuraea pusilla TaxID=46177 RepID=UPI003326FF84